LALPALGCKRRTLLAQEWWVEPAKHPSTKKDNAVNLQLIGVVLGAECWIFIGL
jgi:hypothetical protein